MANNRALRTQQIQSDATVKKTSHGKKRVHTEFDGAVQKTSPCTQEEPLRCSDGPKKEIHHTQSQKMGTLLAAAGAGVHTKLSLAEKGCRLRQEGDPTETAARPWAQRPPGLMSKEN